MAVDFGIRIPPKSLYSALLALVLEFDAFFSENGLLIKMKNSMKNGILVMRRTDSFALFTFLKKGAAVGRSKVRVFFLIKFFEKV